MQRTSVGHGAFVIGSRRGTSSHQYNPMMILAEKETTEDAGTCYGMSFVYSGGFKAEVEKDPVRADKNADGTAGRTVFLSTEKRRGICDS